MQGFAGLFSHTPSKACLVDLTPPTFAGITGLAAQQNGSLTASWAAASDSSPPLDYEVYIQEATSVGLFNLSNLTMITRNLQASVFQLPSTALLQAGITYYVGVRAVDAVGNRDNNIVSLSAVSFGVPDSSILAAINALALSGASTLTAVIEDDSLKGLVSQS